MSTHNICFRGEIRKIFTSYPLLSRPMQYGGKLSKHCVKIQDEYDFSHFYHKNIITTSEKNEKKKREKKRKKKNERKKKRKKNMLMFQGLFKQMSYLKTLDYIFSDMGITLAKI